MKTLLTYLLILCGLTFASIAEPESEPKSSLGPFESEPIPKGGFKNFAELDKWAGSSSFGGGWATRLDLDGVEVLYSKRSVTSGRATTELIFFVRYKDHLKLFVNIPWQFGEYRVSVIKKEIVVELSASEGWVTAMKISSEMLPPRSPKTEQVDADQPATALESKDEGDEKPKPESEARSQ